jgi:hypothetical protein
MTSTISTDRLESVYHTALAEGLLVDDPTAIQRTRMIRHFAR